MANAAGEMAGCFVRWAMLKCVVYAPCHRKYFRAVYTGNVSYLLRTYEDLVGAICDNETKGLLPSCHGVIDRGVSILGYGAEEVRQSFVISWLSMKSTSPRYISSRLMRIS